MIDLKGVTHHPAIEEIVEVLCNKTQNTDKGFFRAEVAFFLGKMASCMRTVIVTKDRGEIPVNIYDLGLIYELVINKNHEAFIKMTFTAPNCPMADEVLEEVQKNVTDVPGIKACNVELVFDPAWDQSMLSDEARLELGLDVIDSSSDRVDPGAGPDYSKEPNS